LAVGLLETAKNLLKMGKFAEKGGRKDKRCCQYRIKSDLERMMAKNHARS
jgi:hypothetical protein